MVSGCSPLSPEQEKRAASSVPESGRFVGGGLGAAGAAGPGGGSSRAYEIGLPAGVVGGAIIDGLMCKSQDLI
jgi:hypothetical protein